MRIDGRAGDPLDDGEHDEELLDAHRHAGVVLAELHGRDDPQRDARRQGDRHRRIRTAAQRQEAEPGEQAEDDHRADDAGDAPQGAPLAHGGEGDVVVDAHRVGDLRPARHARGQRVHLDEQLVQADPAHARAVDDQRNDERDVLGEADPHRRQVVRAGEQVDRGARVRGDAVRRLAPVVERHGQGEEREGDARQPSPPRHRAPAEDPAQNVEDDEAADHAVDLA